MARCFCWSEHFPMASLQQNYCPFHSSHRLPSFLCFAIVATNQLLNTSSILFQWVKFSLLLHQFLQQVFWIQFYNCCNQPTSQYQQYWVSCFHSLNCLSNRELSFPYFLLQQFLQHLFLLPGKCFLNMLSVLLGKIFINMVSIFSYFWFMFFSFFLEIFLNMVSVFSSFFGYFLNMVSAFSSS